MNKTFDNSHILLNETYHQLFFLIIDQWIESMCIYILISFSIFLFSFSLSRSHSFSSFRQIFIHIALGMRSHFFFLFHQWFNLSLAAIDLIYSHTIAYNIESSPAAIIGNDRYWIACCFLFQNEKLIT